mmetsp:Transcript_45830/g.129827  ORF Transcript_45830/g.129827 Transcript_45830/m.129827 type:complete len:204 (+) Transcript_45830:287-898(+)
MPLAKACMINSSGRSKMSAPPHMPPICIGASCSFASISSSDRPFNDTMANSTASFDSFSACSSAFAKAADLATLPSAGAPIAACACPLSCAARSAMFTWSLGSGFCPAICRASALALATEAWVSAVMDPGGGSPILAAASAASRCFFGAGTLSSMPMFCRYSRYSMVARSCACFLLAARPWEMNSRPWIRIVQAQFCGGSSAV